MVLIFKKNTILLNLKYQKGTIMSLKLNCTELLVLRICYLLFSICMVLQAQSSAIKLAPLPMSNPIQTTKIFSPFARHVSSIVKKEVNLVHFTNYDDILLALIQNRIDLAYLGPLPFASYKHKFNNAKPLVGFLEEDGSKGYSCVLISSAFDNISYDNLKGKKIALTQSLSTCGYFSTSQLLKQISPISIEQMKFKYLKKHTKVAKSIIKGQYLLGGVKDSVAKKYESLGLKIVASSKKYPSFIIVANTNTLSKESIEYLQNRLLKTKKEIFSKWGEKISYGLYKVESEDFDHIGKELSKMIIPKKGNF